MLHGGKKLCDIQRQQLKQCLSRKYSSHIKNVVWGWLIVIERCFKGVTKLSGNKPIWSDSLLHKQINTGCRFRDTYVEIEWLIMCWVRLLCAGLVWGFCALISHFCVINTNCFNKKKILFVFVFFLFYLYSGVCFSHVFLSLPCVSSSSITLRVVADGRAGMWMEEGEGIPPYGKNDSQYSQLADHWGPKYRRVAGSRKACCSQGSNPRKLRITVHAGND